MPMRMLMAMILTALLTTAAAAQAPPSDPVADELAALLAAEAASELGRVETYQAFRPRFEAFVKAHRGTESEVRATLWLVQNTWWLRPDGTMESTSMPLAEDLIRRHPTSPQIGLLTEYRYVFTKDQQESMFERLLKVSPHPEVKAAAHFGLAQMSPPRSADGTPNPHLATLLAEFADVRWRQTTFGRIADARLNPHAAADLAVGKTAPEIEGVDQDGKPMKLSDYRGKVVLVDFWGDW
ncbi:MAG: redoxin domain-containing protein [Phycisphaerales bacterium]|nr:redoxin domain-containing protein [Phycisphaerales bacterium]